MRPPQQKRSQETLDRIVAAAETLLEQRRWADIGVADLTALSGVSVGSFYARFGDKEALLDYLDDLYTQAVVSMIERNASKISQAVSLTHAVQILTDTIFDFFSKKTGLVRALVMRARDGDQGASARTARMTAEIPKIIDAFEAHKAEIIYEDWRIAVAEAFSIVFHAIREQLLFPQSLALSLSRQRMRKLLARMFIFHLTIPETV